MMLVGDQIQRMRRSYPAFNVVFNGGWCVEWRGPLRPFAKTYLVRVVMVHPRAIGDLRVMPTIGANVTLISPALELQSEHDRSAWTPHVYWNKDDLQHSRLCLFDPATTEWTFDMAIADTIVPWTIDWLASYEGWLATGEWTGGGRMHSPIPK